MNIVLCDKNCKYQIDGYCNINYYQSVTNSKINDCPYFFNKNDNYDNLPKPSLLENIDHTFNRVGGGD